MRPADQPRAVPFGGDLAGQPEYFTLPVVRGVDLDGTPCLVSAWELEVDELTEIQRTGRLWLTILGTRQPPVRLSVRSPFEGQGG